MEANDSGSQCRSASIHGLSLIKHGRKEGSGEVELSMKYKIRLHWVPGWKEKEAKLVPAEQHFIGAPEGERSRLM